MSRCIPKDEASCLRISTCWASPTWIDGIYAICLKLWIVLVRPTALTANIVERTFRAYLSPIPEL